MDDGIEPDAFGVDGLDDLVEPMLLERGPVVQVALLDCREVPLLRATEVRRDALDRKSVV